MSRTVTCAFADAWPVSGWVFPGKADTVKEARVSVAALLDGLLDAELGADADDGALEVADVVVAPPVHPLSNPEAASAVPSSAGAQRRTEGRRKYTPRA
jgi:hypothetical protein